MKQRIVYIDNLKALAIFTVVVDHVFWFSWDHYSDNIWYYLIKAYNMPLFFFLSGMFAKDNMNPGQLGRKAKQLLIPTLVVGSISTIIRGTFNELLFDSTHCGYWFLPTLFVMFTLFYIRCLMMKGLRKLFKFNETLTVALDVLFLFGVLGCSKIAGRYLSRDIINLFCLGGIYDNAVFFWLGFLIWKYKVALSPFLHKYKDWLYAICFLCFGALFFYIHYSGYETRGLLTKIMAVLTIPLMMILFRKVTIGNGKCQSVMSYIGAHTLEIYVLQYFFLPTKYQLGDSIRGGQTIYSWL